MTRHESRRPSPNVTGPSIPEENLQKGQIESWGPARTSAIKGKRQTYVRMVVLADSHTKNILMKCFSVLSSTETGRIPIKLQTGEIVFWSEVEIRYAPRSSTPQAPSFSETNRVKLAAEVIQLRATESSNDFFSSKLFVGLCISAGSPILRLTLEKGGESQG